jgi:hypothetical protein
MIKKILILTSVLAVLVSARAVSFAAWTGPTLTPPYGNVVVGATNQWTTSGNNAYNSNSANVGIGTTAPIYKLDVGGSLGVSGTTVLGAVTYLDSIYKNAAADMSLNSAMNFGFNFSTNVGGTQTSRLFISNPGNVGIGTVSPGSALHIVGSSGVTLQIKGVTGNGIYSDIKLGNADHSAGIQGLHVSSGNTALIFKTENYSGDGYVERVRINNLGNVGIGTASPDANYKITTTAGGIKAENSSVTEPAGFFNNLSTGPDLKVDTGGIKFSDGTIQTTAAAAAGGDMSVTNFTASGIANFGTGMSSPNIQIYNNQIYTTSSGMWLGTSATYPLNLGAQSATNMTILPGGNVGIGTATPVGTLDVNGALYANNFTGMISFFVGATCPTGWALANGAAVANSGESAKLYAYIGTIYGGSHNLPDLTTAGRFIRSTGGSAAALGTAQADQVQTHTHYEWLDQGNRSAHYYPSVGGNPSGLISTAGNQFTYKIQTGYIYPDSGSRYGAETRSINYAMTPCVKY